MSGEEPHLPEPWAVVDAYESTLGVAERRAGAWYTPRTLADALTRWAATFLPLDPAPRCLDPACGAGAFLLASAEMLAERGLDPITIVERHLIGVDIDADALRNARAALVLWARGRGAPRDPTPVLVHGDALTSPLMDDIEADLILGNPPFQSQLSTDTMIDQRRRRMLERRFGLAGAYTDTASWFLAAAVRWLGDGGVACLLQPQSIIGARDAGALRSLLVDRDLLAGLWWDDHQWFEAAVRVCAPIVRRTANAHQVRRSIGVPVVEGVAFDARDASSFATMVADMVGIPHVGADVLFPNGPSAGIERIGDRAKVTAGFRDEYYGLIAALVSDTDGAPTDPAPLVTVGHVDPAVIRWADHPVRLAKATRQAPVVDCGRLHGRVAHWVESRRVPKLVVASQGRVIEAAADPDGLYVPLTPLISVEPTDSADLWKLLAVVLAPPIAAASVAARVGTGLGEGSVRLRAVDLAAIPLPSHDGPWSLAAAILAGVDDRAASRVELVDEVGRLMCAAYGMTDVDAAPVLAWWSDRQPRRRHVGPIHPDDEVL